MLRVGLFVLVLFAAVGCAHRDYPTQQRFVVYFSEWSAWLDDEAQGVVDNAAKWLKSRPNSVALADGFASPDGRRKTNVLLADLRAQVVLDRMADQDGIDPQRLREHGHGPVQFVETAQESRRVEIIMIQP